MRACVPIPCFFPNGDFADAVRTVASLGFDAVETYDWQGLDIPRVREALTQTGVELLSICTTEFCMTDPLRREAWLAGLENSCQAAVALGASKIITQVGQDTGAPPAHQHQSILCGLQAGARILERYGVTLMIEPLNVLFDHPGYYLTRAEEAFCLVREANSPYVKVVYDIYHQQITEGNIIPTVTANLDCIAHLHGAGHPGRHEWHLGESDYGVILAAIERAGYRGAIGLEYGPTVSPVQSLKDTKKRYFDKALG